MDLVMLMHESNQFYVLLLSLFVCSFLYLLKLSVFRAKKLNLPPSPPKLPIIGNLHQLGSQPHKNVTDLSKKYGPVMLLHFGKTPAVIVSSAEMFTEVVKADGPVFSNKPQTNAANSLFPGIKDLAFSPYGDFWRQAKKITLVHLFSQRKVQSFQLARADIAANVLEEIRHACRTGATVDLSETFIMASSNMVSRTVFGRDYEKLDGWQNFAEAIKEGVDLLGDFCFEDQFSFLGWVDSLNGFRARLKKTTKHIHSFLDGAIEKHLEKKNDKYHEKEFVDILLDLPHDPEMPKSIQFDRDNIKQMIVDMYFAGIDTTALVMEWAMTELMKNPSKMKIAQEEVRRVIGEKSKIDESDINQMKYLKCVVKETLRFHPPVALMPRETTAVSTKLGGYDIPPKVRVMINIWGIQRDPKYWDNPLEFIPERHENSSTADHIDQSHQYVPFGAGKRGCPGMSFGTASVESMLAHLLYWFDWKMPDGERGEDMDVSEVLSFVLRKKKPLNVVPVMHSF